YQMKKTKDPQAFSGLKERVAWIVELFRKDGDNVARGLKFGKVHGKAHSIVVAERVVLNFMQRMSGIARLTK
ncbi:hypothetical protein M8C21_030987, partial [Ambrosia artemisiifolia]